MIFLYARAVDQRTILHSYERISIAENVGEGLEITTRGRVMETSMVSVTSVAVSAVCGVGLFEDRVC